MTIRISFLLLIALCFAACGSGALDPDFGVAGVLDWGRPGERTVPEDSVRLTDGRTAVVGFSDGRGIVISVEPDGTLSPGFGAGGVVEMVLPGTNALRSVVALEGGGMVVGGEVRATADRVDLDFLLVGLRQDGTPDPAFNDGFPVVIDFGGAEDSCQAVARMPDGGFVAVGTSDGDIAAARLAPDGALDFAFGTGGKATWSFGGDSRGRAVVVQDDGGIVIGGSIARGGVAHDSVYVLRANPEGVLDATFGVGGLWEALRDGEDTTQNLVVDADGNILFAGVTAGDVLVGRLLPDGTPDPIFGTNGLFVQDLGVVEYATDLALQPDGRILVIAAQAQGFTSDILLLRLLPWGAPDPDFAGNGSHVRDLCPWDVPLSVTLEPDGDAVIASLCSIEAIPEVSTINVLRVILD